MAEQIGSGGISRNTAPKDSRGPEAADLREEVDEGDQLGWDRTSKTKCRIPEGRRPDYTVAGRHGSWKN